jgi:ComF family protein
MHLRWDAPRAFVGKCAAVLPGRLQTWQSATVDLLFPPECAVCASALTPEADGAAVCQRCRRQLCDECTLCDRCGARLPADAGPLVNCAHCKGRRFAFETVVPLGRYQGPMREAVLTMKHANSLPLSTAMGNLLANFRAERLASLRVDAVVPIPMHWRRRLWRGVNSPEVLAARLARWLNVPLADRLLVRRRATRPQADLPHRLRRANLRGAFQVRKHADLPGARILLVDDILTTGATCHEAAKALRAAGAAGVAVAVLARAAGEPSGP